MVRAFLIGAGATTAQYDKAPLCKDFFARLRNYNNKLYLHLNNITKSYRDKHLNSKSLTELDIEDVMKIFHKHFSGPVQTSFLISLYKAIYLLLGSATNSSKQYFLDYLNGTTTMDPPTTFQTLFENPNLKEEDFFMTLNYDLYLDREIFTYKNRRKIDYGISKEFIQKSDIALAYPQTPFHNKLSLYHLHGALNWEYGQAQMLKISQGAINPTYSGGANLCLVPPGKKQVTSNQFLKIIWLSSQLRLNTQADELIIIGCGLNPDDTELISLVTTFVNKRGEEKVKIIYKSDPNDSTVEKNYEKVIGKNYKSYDQGFNLENDGKAIDFIFE